MIIGWRNYKHYFLVWCDLCIKNKWSEFCLVYIYIISVASCKEQEVRPHKCIFACTYRIYYILQCWDSQILSWIESCSSMVLLSFCCLWGEFVSLWGLWSTQRCSWGLTTEESSGTSTQQLRTQSSGVIGPVRSSLTHHSLQTNVSPT